MQYFIFVLTQNILPIFIQIGIGFIIQKKFHLSIPTLSKIQIYVLIPALLFNSIYTSEIKSDVIGQVIIFIGIIFIFLLLSGTLLSKLFKFPHAKEKAFINSLILSNQGNYLIPLLGLLFEGEIAAYAISLQLMIMLFHNVILNTFGLYNASGGTLKGKAMVKRFFGLPMIYVFIVGLLLKNFHIPIWQPIMSSIKIMGSGFVTVALLTLGAQLSETKFGSIDLSIFLSNTVKLILAPALAFGLVFLLGYHGIVAKVLIIGAAAPSAVNSVLWAIEFNGDADYASRTVLTSTLLSTITITVIIQLLTRYL